MRVHRIVVELMGVVVALGVGAAAAQASAARNEAAAGLGAAQTAPTQIADAAAVQGVALSNALRADVP